MKIVIHSPSYDPSSGGIIVLHKLCDILIGLGYDAGFYVDSQPFYVNSHYNFRKFSLDELDPSNDLIVYPEIVWGNPLGFKKVVRYIMNVGHVTLGRKDTWGESDKWIYYSERFYDKIKPREILTVSDSKLEYFKDYGVPRTYKACFTYRKRLDKGTPPPIVHPPDAIEIPFNISDEELINIFNVCERFYSYDPKTHLNVLASLCGCDSIIVPEDESREEVIDKSAKQQYGIAFGVQEIEQARQSRPQLRTFLEQGEQKQILDVDTIFTKLTKEL